jgi:hypothetical protein
VAQLSARNPEAQTRPSVEPPTAVTAARHLGALAGALAASVSAAASALAAHPRRPEAWYGAMATAVSLARAQATKPVGPGGAARLPYALLRRGRGYDVRRYSALVGAVAGDDVSVEAYLSGANAAGAQVLPLSPLVFTSPTTVLVPLEFAVDSAAGSKAAASPLPNPGLAVDLVAAPAAVVAVRRWEAGRTIEEQAAGLRKLLAADGLVAAGGALAEVRTSYASFQDANGEPPPDELWMKLASSDWPM